ncbi:hypothetical protein OPV22_002416 [Ensete ventricosum]|uniref:Uncharacterized protein n=1 Tax=Ensete ventricosum TaxID=4639 RepID=A0AAV8RXU5_ENSVE|nr:hypothetical protein OPV22_002416 [Ensete ventricosum]
MIATVHHHGTATVLLQQMHRLYAETSTACALMGACEPLEFSASRTVQGIGYALVPLQRASQRYGTDCPREFLGLNKQQTDASHSSLPFSLIPEIRENFCDPQLQSLSPHVINLEAACGVKEDVNGRWRSDRSLCGFLPSRQSMY